MKIKHDFTNNTTLLKLDSKGQSGVITFISWQGLLPYLHSAFEVASHERLVSVEASEYGLTAAFELKETV